MNRAYHDGAILGRRSAPLFISLALPSTFAAARSTEGLAGHGADPFPPVDVAQVELDRLNRPFDQPTRIVVAEHG